MSPNKILLGIGLLFVSLCVFLFLAGVFFPRAIGFLDGIVCPNGMHLSNRVDQYTNEVGNPGSAVNMDCVAEGRTAVDAIPRMLFILFGLGIAAGGFFIWAYGGIKRVNWKIRLLLDTENQSHLRNP